MKVIFLDIDGVLNSHNYLTRPDLQPDSIFQNIDPQKIQLLGEIVKATGAKLVLSSSWRNSLTAALQPADYEGRCLIGALALHGLALFDKTPFLEEERGAEIQQWLAGHGDTDRFAILDDDHFDWGGLEPYWVKTSYYTGLTGEHAAAAIDLLNGK